MKKLAAAVAALAVVIGGYVGSDQLANDPPGIPDGFTYAVDSYGGLTFAEALAMKAEGVTLYIQALSALPPNGLVQPADRVNSLRNARAAGLGIAGYALTDCAPGGRDDMEFARLGIPADIWSDLIFVAVDVEVACQSLADLNQALDTVGLWGKGRVVYTSYNWWVNVKGNPAKPLNTALWNAWWDNDPDFDFEHKPYGFFTPEDVIGEQWHGQVLVGGHPVDRNIFRFEWASPAPTPTPVITPPSCCETVWREAAPRWRWFPPADGLEPTSYDPVDNTWYNAAGGQEWGPCLSWGGRVNLRLSAALGYSVRLHAGESFHDDLLGWTVAPAC